jgi:predicted secreted protein
MIYVVARMGDAEYLSAQKGKTVVISLGANPSAGYEWTTEFDPAFLRLIKKQVVSSTDRAGADVTEKFEFEALASGVTRLRMIYRRPWETANSNEKNYIIQIA